MMFLDSNITHDDMISNEIIIKKKCELKFEIKFWILCIEILNPYVSTFY